MVVRSWGRFSNFYSRVVVIRTCGLFFKVHLARGRGSNMGPPFKVHLARGSSSIVESPFKVLLVPGTNLNLCSFSKCTSRVVMVVLGYV